MELSSATKTKNDKAWRKVSEEIKRIFRAAVLLLQEKGTMTSIQAKKFLCSGQSQIKLCLYISDLSFHVYNHWYGV